MGDARLLAQAAAGRCVAALWNRQQEPGAPSTTLEAAARAEFLGATPPPAALTAWLRQLDVARAQQRLRVTEDEAGGQVLQALQAVGTAAQARAAEAAEREAGVSSGSGGARPAGDYPGSGRWYEAAGPPPGEAAWWEGCAGEVEVAVLFLQHYEIRDPASWQPSAKDPVSWQKTHPSQPAGDCWQKVVSRNSLQARGNPK